MPVVYVPSSIDQMSEVMRHAVESGEKLKEELVLKQDEFLVNEVSPQRSKVKHVITRDLFKSRIHALHCFTHFSYMVSSVGFEDPENAESGAASGTHRSRQTRFFHHQPNTLYLRTGAYIRRKSSSVQSVTVNI